MADVQGRDPDAASALKPRTVVIVLWDGVRMLDVAGPLEVFGVANALQQGYDIITASLGGRAVATVQGPSLAGSVALEDVRGDVDTVLISGGLHYQEASSDMRLITEVKRLATDARRVVSVCTGAFVLAAAGLLHGRRATTHWARCDELATVYPATVVDADAIFVRDGRISTSAGVTAGIDLALAMVEEDHGADCARRTAKALVFFMQRPGGQSQFSSRTRPASVHSQSIKRVLDSVLQSPAADHSEAAMAQEAAFSVRHFRRVFTEQVGTTPARFVTEARVEKAQALLHQGDEGLDYISRQAGFGSPETMRRAFLRVLGVSPGVYRQRFSPHRLG